MTIEKEWIGMPEFIQEKIVPFHILDCYVNWRMIRIRFENAANLSDFNKLMNTNFNEKDFSFNIKSFDLLSEKISQNITEKTKSIWHPFKPHKLINKKKYVSDNFIKNKYPVYIVSKGRYKNCLTHKALNKMSVDHYIVVEQSEYELYKEHTNANILILPQQYLDDYESCDDLGNEKSKGPGAARNFCIDHSTINSFIKHWVMDDNLHAFHYLNENEKYEIRTNSTIRAAEDFIDRYSNIPVSGFNYYSFAKKTSKLKPFLLNTRIYSCLLIDSSFGYRWRGRYNEDTDLSLRVLKDGFCTVQFNAFLCGKVTTKRMKGGNTKEFYSKEGTFPKSKMLEDLHSDVSKVVWKFNRWHHNVNYTGFKNNELIKIDNTEYEKVNNYGMKKVDFNLR